MCSVDSVASSPSSATLLVSACHLFRDRCFPFVTFLCPSLLGVHHPPRFPPSATSPIMPTAAHLGTLIACKRKETSKRTKCILGSSLVRFAMLLGSRGNAIEQHFLLPDELTSDLSCSLSAPPSPSFFWSPSKGVACKPLHDFGFLPHAPAKRHFSYKRALTHCCLALLRRYQPREENYGLFCCSSAFNSSERALIKKKNRQ